MELKFISGSSEETMKLATKMAKILPNGITILLTGDLGAGKTTFTRGLAKGLNINETVQSPTFNIMKVYFKGDKPLVHIDAYRLDKGNIDIGLEEFIGVENGLTVIEWPNYISSLIPDNHIEISFKHDGEDKRTIIIKGDKNIIGGISL